MGNNQVTSQYSTKQFFNLNTPAVAINSIKKYLGESCTNITDNGKNCSRSLKYVQDNKEKNCTKYCINNSDKWINDLFVKYPKYIVYNTKEIKIKGIIYQFISNTIKTEIYVQNTKISLSIYENNKEIMDIKNISLNDLLNIFDIKKYNELIIQIIPTILLTNSVFIGFKDSRLFKPTKYWDTGYNYPPTISINLEDGNTRTPSTLNTDIYGYKQLNSKYTLKQPKTETMLISNKFTGLF